MISVKNLYKDFGSLHILKAVSCEVKKGEKVVLIGPSGSGKSTLLRCINQLETPTFGEIWMDGKLLTAPDPYLHFDVIRLSKTYLDLTAAGVDDAAAIQRIKAEDLLKKKEGAPYHAAMKQIENENRIDIDAARQKMGMVFQHFNLFSNMTILQNLTFAPVQLKLKTKAEAEERARELLARIGLSDKADVYPATLSGGQKQRVAIAGIIAMQPKCIILDEPTAMLDPHGRKEVMATIKRMNREQGVTIVLITHYMDEAAQAERVVVMDKGRVVLDNTPPKVFSQVEFLKGIGLDVPQVTELAWELRRAGCDIPEDIITEDECVEALAKLFGGKAQQHIGGV